MLPLVALVGRPNVGKSALFNRLIEQKHAIVSEVAGTTRDMLNGTIVVKKKEIELVDTAGLMSKLAEQDTLQKPVQAQARVALQEADLILFCVDGTMPLTQEDLAVAKVLREKNKAVILVATKIDTSKQEQEADEIYRLGFATLLFTSAEHNRGIVELKETIYAQLKKNKVPFTSAVGKKKKSEVISFAILGKPNVGKSSLFNAMLQKSRAVVSDVPGTTRDMLDSEIMYGEKTLRVIDTAGLKRPGRIERGIEYYSSLRSMKAIKRADVCLLVLDAQEKISKMDQAVSRYILEEKKGLILIINKWDLLEKEKNIADRFLTYLQDRFDYISWAPVLFVSAKSGKNVSAILERVTEVFQARQQRIETGKLNRFVEEAVGERFPTGTKKINPKIFYATQIETAPPHFLLFVNEKEAFHFSWLRYFENRLREKFGFVGTPVMIELRNREREDRKKK